MNRILWQAMTKDLLLLIPSNAKFVKIMSSCYLELFLFLKVQKTIIEKYTFKAKILYKRTFTCNYSSKSFFPGGKDLFPSHDKHHFSVLVIPALVIPVISWVTMRVICIFLLCYSIGAWGE